MTSVYAFPLLLLKRFTMRCARENCLSRDSSNLTSIQLLLMKRQSTGYFSLTRSISHSGPDLPRLELEWRKNQVKFPNGKLPSMEKYILDTSPCVLESTGLFKYEICYLLLFVHQTHIKLNRESRKWLYRFYISSLIPFSTVPNEERT